MRLADGAGAGLDADVDVSAVGIVAPARYRAAHDGDEAEVEVVRLPMAEGTDAPPPPGDRAADFRQSVALVGLADSGWQDALGDRSAPSAACARVAFSGGDTCAGAPVRVAVGHEVATARSCNSMARLRSFDQRAGPRAGADADARHARSLAVSARCHPPTRPSSKRRGASPSTAPILPVCIGLGDAGSEVDQLLGVAQARGAHAVRVWAPAVESVDYLGHALLVARAILHDAGTLEIEPALANTGEHLAQNEMASAEEEFARESYTGEKTRPRFIAPAPEALRRTVERTWLKAPPPDSLILSCDPVVGPAVAELLGIAHWGRVRSAARRDHALVIERTGRRSGGGAPWTPELPCVLVMPQPHAKFGEPPTTVSGSIAPLGLEPLDLTPMDLLHRRHFRLRAGALPMAPAAHFTDADALVARLLADEALARDDSPLALAPKPADG